MASFEEFNKLGEELENLLILRYAPIAIKLLKTEADIPRGPYAPSVTLDSTWRCVRRSRSCAGKERASYCSRKTIGASGRSLGSGSSSLTKATTTTSGP